MTEKKKVKRGCEIRQDGGARTIIKSLREELTLSCNAALAAFSAEISTLREEIKQEMEAIRSETSSSLQGLRHEVEEEIHKLRQGHTQMTTEQADMAQHLNDAIERIQKLENENEVKSKEVKRLLDKCTDLESRSRRQNLRFIGIPEGAEGTNPTKFMTELIHEVLGTEDFTSPVVIDRAHRSLASKPKIGDRLRLVLVRMHYYTQKEKILGLAKGKERLLYRGSPIHIYPDLPVKVSKLRATFNPVKVKLREAKIIWPSP